MSKAEEKDCTHDCNTQKKIDATYSMTLRTTNRSGVGFRE